MISATVFFFDTLATVPGAGTAAHKVSLFEAFFIQRDASTGNIEVLGSLIIWLLLALSMVSLGLIGVIAVETQRERIVPADAWARLRAALARGDVDGAIAQCSTESSFLESVLRSALMEARHGTTTMLHVLEHRSDELTINRFRRMEPLNVIGNVSPMIGLFGTVYGMILAFSTIVSAGGTPDPVELAAGIGTALTTTFWGLVVAIPSLAAYALLRNRVDALTTEATRVAEQLVGVCGEQETVEHTSTTPTDGKLNAASSDTVDA